jgi:hypothetical protein
MDIDFWKGCCLARHPPNEFATRNPPCHPQYEIFYLHNTQPKMRISWHIFNLGDGFMSQIFISKDSLPNAILINDPKHSFTK